MAMQRKTQSTFGVKLLLTTFSLTLVLGFWNLFSKKPGNTLETNQLPPVTELWTEPDPNLAPLPTIVPLVWSLSPIANSGQTTQNDAGLPTIIREVVSPTQQPIHQQQAPLVQSIPNGQTGGQQQQQPSTAQQPQVQPTAVTTTGSSK